MRTRMWRNGRVCRAAGKTPAEDKSWIDGKAAPHLFDGEAVSVPVAVSFQSAETILRVEFVLMSVVEGWKEEFVFRKRVKKVLWGTALWVCSECLVYGEGRKGKEGG